jgi:hypothetical protein
VSGLSFWDIQGFAAGQTSIGDGGSDMYDGGNIVSVGGTTLTYGDNCDTLTGGGQSYKMDITTNGISVWVFDSVDAVAISGNLGADGSGARTHGSYSYKGWTGFWKQTHSANDPSVTHLWVTNAASAAADTTDTYTNSDADSLTNVGGASALYLFWGVPSGAQTSDAQFQAVIEAAVNSMSVQASCSDISAGVNAVSGLSFWDIQGFAAGQTSIGDGGADMYDTGNIVSAGGATLTYGDNCDELTGGSQSYSMDINANGISVWAFDETDAVAISGNLGADGSGQRTHGSYTYNGWTGFWKQTHSANDPSVTHLWVTDATSAVADTTTSYTNDDQDSITNVGGNSVLYLFWGVPSGAQTSDAQFQAVIRAAVDSM